MPRLNNPKPSRSKATGAKPPEHSKMAELFPEDGKSGESPASEPDTSASSKRKKVSKPDLAARAVAFQPDPAKLQSLEEQEDHLRIVLYGDYGVGKTTSAMSLAERGTVVVVDPENSVRLRALSRQGIKTSNIKLWPEWEYDSLQQLHATVKQMLRDDPESVFAVVFDTVTALSQFWLENAVSAAIKRPSMQRKHPERTQWDVFQDDFGVVVEQIRSLITRQFFALPCHVVVLAHTRRGEDEDGAVRVGPALSPAAQASLLTYADWVYRLGRDSKGKRILDTEPRGRVEAKDRFGTHSGRIAARSLAELLADWEEPF